MVAIAGRARAGPLRDGGVLDDAADMVCLVNPEGRFTYVNPAWQACLGYAEGAAADLCVFDLVHPDHREAFNRAFRRALRGKQVARLETVLLAQDGRPVSVEGSCSRRVREGRTEAVLGIFRDVTDRKRAEEVLARQAADLVNADRLLTDRDRELAETLDQARKYREAQARAAELLKINAELKAEIARRRQAEAQIRASLREKEVLLKEIHHRVKNNMQIISSLLNLQAERIGEPQVLDMYRESQSRIRTMALIHERLYGSEDLARVDFAEYVQSLVNYLVRSYSARADRIRTRVEVGQVFLGIDTAIPCGLIVNELVSNALKYAFPEGQEGEVYVTLQPDGAEGYMLVVGDAGVGFPEGLDYRETETLGLQLVCTLADQLEGTLELDSGRGTAFRLRFKT